jgi:hypothetical protein
VSRRRSADRTDSSRSHLAAKPRTQQTGRQIQRWGPANGSASKASEGQLDGGEGEEVRATESAGVSIEVSPVTILNGGGVEDNPHRHPLAVDHGVDLAALHMFAGVVVSAGNLFLAIRPTGFRAPPRMAGAEPGAAGTGSSSFPLACRSYAVTHGAALAGSLSPTAPTPHPAGRPDTRRPSADKSAAALSVQISHRCHREPSSRRDMPFGARP